jgi:trafficking protein particle complex subunit 2
MSYYFAIIGPHDTPLFTHTFGTSKLGGDGQARFKDEAKYFNQFLVHAALDLVEEVQWGVKDLYVLPSPPFHPPIAGFKPPHEITLTQDRYLRKIDSHQDNHIHCFLTGGNVKFMLLMNPDPSATTYSSYPGSQPPSRPATAATAGGNRQSTASLAANPTSQGTEDAVRVFMMEVSFFFPGPREWTWWDGAGRALD